MALNQADTPKSAVIKKMEKKINKPKISNKSAQIDKNIKVAAKVLKAQKPAVKQEAPKLETEAGVIKKFGLNNLMIPFGAHKRKKLLGRGSSSGHGKTSTRGSKGQTSRAGRDMYAGFEGGQTPMIRRMPKRGFTSKFKKIYQIINLADLSRIKDENISPEVLEKSGLIKDKNKLIKVLGEGEIKQSITIQAHAFSKKAQEKLANSGSKFEVLNA